MRMGIAVVLLVVAVAGVAVAADPPKDEPKQTFHDYRCMLPFMGEGVAYPDDAMIAKQPRLWPKVPWHLNAAYYYARAGHAASSLVGDGVIPAGSLSSDKPYAGDKAALAAYAAAVRPACQLMLDAAPLRVCDLPFFVGGRNRRMGAPSPPLLAGHILAGMRHLARACSDAAFVEELEGRADAAAEMCLRAVRAGGQLGGDGVMIQRLVAIAVTTFGLETLNRTMANASLSDDTLRRVIAECRAAQALPDVMIGMWDDEEAFQNLQPLPKGTDIAPAQRAIRRALDAPFHELLAGAGLRERIENEVPPVDTGSILMRQMAPAMARAAVPVGRNQFALRATMARAAIQLYERKHGKLPATLDALVPEFLAVVPEDPFTGKPLRYVVADDGAWRVWSVGEDLKDDGGTADVDARRIYSLEPDYVMPSELATNEDVRRIQR